MAAENQEPAIKIEGLRKAFGEQKVLDGINLEARHGETLAVLGRSGTGKSVLLKIMIGLLAPDGGSVKICGTDIAQLRPDDLNELRKKIGFLFQQAALYDSMTIEDNVVFPMSRHGKVQEEEARKRARELLASLGMKEGLDKLPSQISGGMQKRVGLARALALDPQILLFDEPTSGLDPITSAEIGKLIADLKEKRGITSVVVTHDVHAAAVFTDRFILMNDGHIVAEGTLADLQKSQDAFVSQFVEKGLQVTYA